jgi:predicted Zn-dependent peptidase
MEHKMFETADGGDADSDFAALGADANAFTTYDRTAYQFTCTEHFEEALAVLLRLTGELHVTEASVEREQAIIAEEIRMDTDNPWTRCYANLLRAMYRRHPIREPVCGSQRSIAVLTPPRLKKAFDRRYTLPDMVLSVTGPVTPEAVWAVVCRTLEGRPGKRLPARADHPHRGPGPNILNEPPGVWRQRIHASMPVAKPLFCLGIKDPLPPVSPRDRLRRELYMAVLQEMLFSDAGAFYNDLFDRGLVSQGLSYDFTVETGCALYDLTGEADDPEAVFDAFLAYIDRRRRDGFTVEEFERSRRIQYADFVTSFDAAEDIAESVLCCTLGGLSLFDYFTEADKLTLGEAEQLFLTTFRPEQYALSVIRPCFTGRKKEERKS